MQEVSTGRRFGLIEGLRGESINADGLGFSELLELVREAQT
jgi:hypothetical protein